MPALHPINVALMPLLPKQGTKSIKRPFNLPGPGFCFICKTNIDPGSVAYWSRRFGVSHRKCADSPDAGPKVADPLSAAEVTSKVDALIANRFEAINDFVDHRVEQLVGPIVAKAVDTAVAARVKPTAVTVTTFKPPTVTVKHPHKDFASLLYLISRNRHCYLWGPPGSGKSTAAYHASKALKRRFAYVALTNTSMESRLFGFMQPQLTGPAKYVGTDLFECYTKGGVFCIDEMDNGPASLLASLNTLLENLEHGSFPCGMVKRHEEFIVVGTGNTSGFGADPLYPERRRFDAAFAARFAYWYWEYDELQERAVALTHNPAAGLWVDWMQATRAWAKVNDPKLVISPRETYVIAQLAKDDVFSNMQLVRSCLFKGTEEARIHRLLAAHPLPVVTSPQEGVPA